MILNIIIGVLVLCILLYASFHDIRCHEINNCIPIELLLIKAVWIFSRPLFLYPLISSVEGMIICSAPVLLSYYLFKGKGLGGGDVKLMIAIGFLLAYPMSIIVIMISCMFIAFYTVIMARLKKIRMKSTAVPFAPFITAGTVVSYILLFIWR